MPHVLKEEGGVTTTQSQPLNMYYKHHCPQAKPTIRIDPIPRITLPPS